MRKSRQADFDQRMKSSATLPQELKVFDRRVSPFIMRQLIEQHKKSYKTDMKFVEVKAYITVALQHISIVVALSKKYMSYSITADNTYSSLCCTRLAVNTGRKVVKQR